MSHSDGAPPAALTEDLAVILPALAALAFVLGLLIRWWALVAPAGFALYVALESDIDEVPPWFLGVAYGVLGASAVAAGVLLRRGLADSRGKRP